MEITLIIARQRVAECVAVSDMEENAKILKRVKYDEGKLRYGLIPPQIKEALACIFTHGAEKYGANTWQNVSRERYEDALERHYQEYLKGNILDESGFPHSFHVLWNAQAIVYKQLESMGVAKTANLWDEFNK